MQQQLQNQQLLQTLMKNQIQQPTLNNPQLYSNTANTHSLNNFSSVYENNKVGKGTWPNDMDNGAQIRNNSNTNNS